ncbi:MAG: ABC transporter substrate-binding protein [Bacillota bacterium]
MGGLAVRKGVLGVLAVVLVVALSTAACTQKSSQKELKVLRVAEVADFKSLDPATGTSSTDRGVQALIFEGLVVYDAQENIQPCLAEKWELSPDKRTWTFYLRQNVKFSDGTPCTACRGSDYLAVSCSGLMAVPTWPWRMAV